eukprot:scaffold174714_cov26-Tisochrysis_lutea.AAC.2
MDVQILCISLTTKACTPCMQGVGASAQQRICHKWRRAARAEPGATDQAQSTQAEACSARRTRQPAHHNTSGGAQHAQSQEQLRMTLYALPVRTLFWCAAHDTRHCTYDFDDGVHKRLKDSEFCAPKEDLREQRMPWTKAIVHVVCSKMGALNF